MPWPSGRTMSRAESGRDQDAEEGRHRPRARADSARTPKLHLRPHCRRTPPPQQIRLVVRPRLTRGAAQSSPNPISWRREATAPHNRFATTSHDEVRSRRYASGPDAPPGVSLVMTGVLANSTNPSSVGLRCRYSRPATSRARWLAIWRSESERAPPSSVVPAAANPPSKQEPLPDRVAPYPPLPNDRRQPGRIRNHTSAWTRQHGRHPIQPGQARRSDR